MLACIAAIAAIAASHAAAADDPQQGPLFDEISALDKASFDAFNRCADPAQSERYASYFAPDIEFYHDNGGVTWTRDEMMASTRKYACGNYTRQLVPGTLKVYPVKGFGAISQGTHEFCQTATGKCEGTAEFVMIWRKTDGRWLVTRTLSYGHRPVERKP
ncbi:MAG TPA: nuclear transport factor 2 family protein [Ramlibacter sp.]|nr:nuclear transport factor 2 family protein [Ramlibacter sp.]